MTDDHALLRAYAVGHSEEAFRALVERHLALVRGVARRLVRDDALAQDVTQAVFILLARKAGSLRPGTVVAGWLYQTTRRVAWQALRADRRRQRHHEELANMQQGPDSDSLWQELAPHLEQAMARLADRDRDAVLLRYFENQSFADVAQALNLSEAAAKMRVGRALEKLRTSIHRAGVPVPAAALGAVLAAHAAPSAQAAMVATVATAVLSPGSAGIATTTLIQSLEVMTWNKMKTLAVAALIALLLAGGATWYLANKPAPSRSMPKLATFEPMAGEWEGTFCNGEDPSTLADPVPAMLIVTTGENGRRCAIEMRVAAPGRREQVYQFSHTVQEGGVRLFSTHDRQIARTDGEGEVIDSFHNPATGEWHAAFRQTFQNNRGRMEGSWHRHGDQLNISSHDEYRSPRGTNHVFSELKLQRRPTPRTAQAR
jgi:RNA polymerase sigma factor (sigma-70 family)